MRRFMYFTVLSMALGLHASSEAAFPRNQIFNGGVVIKLPTTLNNPTVAPTVATSGSVGSCTNANTYRMYVTWGNGSGETLISPASSDIVPSPSSRQITVTRPSIPSNATFWNAYYSKASDGHTNKIGCGTSGAKPFASALASTFNCGCQGSVDNDPSANTTGILDGLVITGGIARSGITVKEVCEIGCPFYRVQHAIDSITDASDTKRYIVFIRAPYQSSETVTAKSYVSIVGEDRNAVLIAKIQIPAAGTEIRIHNVSVGDTAASNIPINANQGGGAGGNIYVSSSILGNAAMNSVDGILDGSGGFNWFVSDVLCRSHFDCNVFKVGGSTAILQNVSAIMLADGSPTSFIYTDAQTKVRVNGATVEQTVTSTGSEEAGAIVIKEINGTPTVASDVIVDGVTININETGVGRTGKTTCLNVGAAKTNSVASQIILSNVDCKIVSVGSNDLYGADIGTDVDHSNWTVKWIGGRIALSGASTRTDVRQAETQAGFVFAMGGVDNGGVFSGAGVITPIDMRLGAFTTKLLGRIGDLAVGACTANEFALDTGGATVEMCWCRATNTWDCWKWAAGGGFTANGPAD